MRGLRSQDVPSLRDSQWTEIGHQGHSSLATELPPLRGSELTANIASLGFEAGVGFGGRYESAGGRWCHESDRDSPLRDDSGWRRAAARQPPAVAAVWAARGSVPGRVLLPCVRKARPN